MLGKASPSFIRKSVYGPAPGPRAAELPGMVGLELKDLFPDTPRAIHTEGGDLSVIRKATEAALKNVPMDMIRPTDKVNILSSQYGYQIMGGDVYAEMIRTIKDVVEERTGCRNVRLRVTTGFRIREPNEIIRHYKLNEYFDGNALGVRPIDKGVPMETEIGTLYGVAQVYDADWIIHAHHGELRELDMHRMINRAIKPFAMSYARMETRAVAHMNFGPRSSNLVAKVIFNSPFVQSKFTFGCFLLMSPEGVIGVDAGNDMEKLDRRLMLLGFKSYGKIRELFSEIRECIAVMDATGEPRYMIGGGMSFGNLTEAELDLFDLDNIPVSLGFGLYERPAGTPKLKSVNPAIKALVFNHMWLGVPQLELPTHIPTIVVGREMADLLRDDPMNHDFMRLAVTSENLGTAMEFARRISRTDKVIVFDGSFGRITLSSSLAEHLIARAPEVDRRVEEQLMPKWLRQRGIDPEELFVREH
ncbi:MAG: hypothetical protein E4G97_02070 [Deltaproteobacteria bacterium]|nr:MAG: hypothetical protein E4G97_02070 [Deltaproteobacteria bacterium]